MTLTRPFTLTRPVTLTLKQAKRQPTVMSKHNFERFTLTFDLLQGCHEIVATKFHDLLYDRFPKSHDLLIDIHCAGP